MAGTSPTLSYKDYVSGIRSLSIEEQLSLLEVILANLKMNLPQKKRRAKVKLSHLKRRNTIKGDPEELVEMQVWEWHEPENLSSI